VFNLEYNIKLGQGDTEEKEVVLTRNGVGIDLTDYIISFYMKNDFGTRFTIPCTNGIVTPRSRGGVIIPFTYVETTTPGEFEGQFIIVDLFGKALTYPLGSYISIRIYESV